MHIKRIALIVMLGWLYAAQAQTEIVYWHSQDQTSETIQALADRFNTSQSDYQVIPEYIGNYQEAAIKLLASIDSSNRPVLYDAELSVFPALVEEGALMAFDEQQLDDAVLADIFPSMWAYGEMQGQRYGLPFAMSLPVLFYNGNVFEQLGVTPPATWEDFEEVAGRLTTRQTKGYISLSIPFIFELMVATRGGALVSDAGEPLLNSPEAVDALEMLQRIAQERHATVRSLAEAELAYVDFVRTKGMMAFAGLATWPQSERFSMAFEIKAAPVPRGVSASVPFTGAQLVVIRGATTEQQQGALAFWEYLMQPDNIATWVEASYFLPPRRSAVPLLEAWYAEDETRGIGLTQIDHAVSRPRTAAYATWQSFLLEAMDKALKGRVPAREALNEAQERALEKR